MNKRSEFNGLRQQLTGLTLPTIDVSGSVMQRIRTMNHKHAAPGKVQHFMKRPRVIWITAAALFFVLSISVSATVLPLSWDGASITIEDDGGKNERIDAFKELIFGKAPTYKETIEEVLNNHKNAKEVLSLDEARRQFPFALLRPDPSKAQPTRSNGALMNVMQQENGKDVGVIGYRPVFHDIYELDNKGWAIVTQRLDQAATDHVQGKINSRSSTYSGNWENVQINDQMMAMFTESKKENRLLIEYKNTLDQVIGLDIIGTGTKEELIKLAEAYTGSQD
jgi:hypothetical protein